MVGGGLLLGRKDVHIPCLISIQVKTNNQHDDFGKALKNNNNNRDLKSHENPASAGLITRDPVEMFGSSRNTNDKKSTNKKGHPYKTKIDKEKCVGV